jgi:hypothetical protein
MRILITKSFARFTVREGIGDEDLRAAVESADRGLIDADLGGGVIRLRLARRGQGKSGGFRSIVLFRKGVRAFYVYGFAKKDLDNITAAELRAFRLLAKEMLATSDGALDAAKRNGTLMEI